jgi:hypothetical protein
MSDSVISAAQVLLGVTRKRKQKRNIEEEKEKRV